MYEQLSILFKYNCENNGYLYLSKYINEKYKIGFNELTKFNLISNEKLNTEQILNNNNIYFIDFKKIKLIDNSNIFKIINLLLISNSKTKLKFIKYDYNIFILFNLNYINELFISKLTFIIENNQQFNNFILFSANTKINNIKFTKLKTLCQLIHLNPFKEFKLNYKENELIISKLLNFDIIKTDLLLDLANKNNINIKKLNKLELFNFIIKNILIYNIIYNNLCNNKIYELSFNLISMFSLKEIIKCCNNIILYSSINNLNNKYNLQCNNKLIKLQYNTLNNFDENINDIIKLKKYLNNVKQYLIPF
jgi:hypothetical protein